MDTNPPSRTGSIDQSIDFPSSLMSMHRFLSARIDADFEDEFARAINIGDLSMNDQIDQILTVFCSL